MRHEQMHDAQIELVGTIIPDTIERWKSSNDPIKAEVAHWLWDFEHDFTATMVMTLMRVAEVLAAMGAEVPPEWQISWGMSGPPTHQVLSAFVEMPPSDSLDQDQWEEWHQRHQDYAEAGALFNTALSSMYAVAVATLIEVGNTLNEWYDEGIRLGVVSDD